MPRKHLRMKAWVLDRYKDSTLDQCTQQLLIDIADSELEFHFNESFNPKPIPTPSVIPIHFQAAVKESLDQYCRTSVIEQVPYGVVPLHDGEKKFLRLFIPHSFQKIGSRGFTALSLR